MKNKKGIAKRTIAAEKQKYDHIRRQVLINAGKCAAIDELEAALDDLLDLEKPCTISNFGESFLILHAHVRGNVTGDDCLQACMHIKDLAAPLNERGDTEFTHDVFSTKDYYSNVCDIRWPGLSIHFWRWNI